MPASPLNPLHDSLVAKRASNSCQLYKSPTSGTRVNSSTPITFEWNTACLQPLPKYVDITLLSAGGQVFHWAYVDAASGSYQTELNAEWWGSKASIQLQVGITASDTPLFLSPFAAGPVFTALNINASPTTASTSSHTGTNSAAVTVAPFVVTGGYLDVSRLGKGLSRGGLAAAILFPILIAFGAIFAYVWFSRRREARRRSEWIDNVDKRMSTISQDWQSMSQNGARPSMHSSRRTPRPSVHSRNMSLLGMGVRTSVATDPEARNRATLYERYSINPFATEDDTQLGPRGRALSAAAAEGRPLSSLINSEKELPAAPNARVRSKSTAADGATAAKAATSRINYPRAPHSHTRTTSTTSNNPYANAMAQRNSIAVSSEDKPLPFPPSAPIPRPRAQSNGRVMDMATRSRVISHVSFADAPRPSEDRRRNLDPEKGMRSSARGNSAGDDYAIDFGDALPALALMRVKSGDFDAIAFPSRDSTALTPTREFLPSVKKDEYFEGMPSTGLGGRTPDEMLKAYASAMASNEKSEEPESSGGVAGNVLASVKKLTGFWRK